MAGTPPGEVPSRSMTPPRRDPAIRSHQTPPRNAASLSAVAQAGTSIKPTVQEFGADCALGPRLARCCDTGMPHLSVRRIWYAGAASSPRAGFSSPRAAAGKASPRAQTGLRGIFKCMAPVQEGACSGRTKAAGGNGNVALAQALEASSGHASDHELSGELPEADPSSRQGEPSVSQRFPSYIHTHLPVRHTLYIYGVSYREGVYIATAS